MNIRFITDRLFSNYKVFSKVCYCFYGATGSHNKRKFMNVLDIELL